jgi:hypothetical protein
MKKPDNHRLPAFRFYSLLVSLYPTGYRQAFGAQMLQTFKDQYTDAVTHQGRTEPAFWFAVVGDEITGITREHLAALKGGGPTMNKYTFGLALGMLMSVAVVLTNVVFPSHESDSEYGFLYAVFYLGLFVLFGVGGYLASRSNTSLRSGAAGGAITALLSIGLTMLTFIVIDNLFLDIVSQQPDKLWGFQHQQTFATMREYVNDGLLRGTLFVLPVITLFGAVFGAIGAGVRKRFLHS